MPTSPYSPTVTDGLEAGGIPRCRGNVMAENPAWRRSVSGWAGEFRRWMSDPSVEGRTFTSIALDYRRVAGPLDIEPVLDSVIREAPAHPVFVKRLAHTALELRPPTGFFRDLVLESGGERAGTLDIKQGGIKPADEPRPHVRGLRRSVREQDARSAR